MSSHYETQEPLPADLIEKIIKRCEAGIPSPCTFHSLLYSRYVNAGLFYLRQLFFGTFDIRVHTDKGMSNGLPSSPVSAVDRLHRGRRLHEILERAERVPLLGEEWQIHCRRSELQPSSWWLRCWYINSFTKIFHINSLAYFRVLRLHVLAGVRVGYVRDRIQG